MKKKVLFLTILFLVTFTFISNLNAKENKCFNYKYFNYLSSYNFLDKYQYDKNNILKICTGDVCTYNFDNDFVDILNRHKDKVVNGISNKEKKLESSLKGVKINKIYFKSCTFIP